MKLTTEINMLMTEGTWAFPTTPKQITKLKKLLKSPLRADKAGDALSGVLGDDDLYDEFDSLIDKGEGSDDVRSDIKSHLKDTLKAYATGKRDIKGMDKDILKELKAVIK